MFELKIGPPVACAHIVHTHLIFNHFCCFSELGAPIEQTSYRKYREIYMIFHLCSVTSDEWKLSFKKVQRLPNHQQKCY